MRVTVKPSPAPSESPQSPFEESAAVSRFRKRVKLVDRFAECSITAGGFAIIAAILGIGVFLFMQIVPLFSGATFTQSEEAALGPALAQSKVALIEERKEQLLLVAEDPAVRIYDFGEAKFLDSVALSGLEGRKITAASYYPGVQTVALGTENGRIWLGELRLESGFEGSVRVIKPVVKELITADVPEGKAVDKIVHRWAGNRGAVVSVLRDQTIALHRLSLRRPLIGAPVKNVKYSEFSIPPEHLVQSIVLSEQFDEIFIGFADGTLERWRIMGDDGFELAESIQASEAGITALSYVLGERSIIVGDASGGVATWSLVSDAAEGTGKHLQRVHRLQPMEDEVTTAIASPRDKGFLTVDAKGHTHLYHMTTERLLSRLRFEQPLALAAMAPRADGVLAVDVRGKALLFDLKNPHPDVSWGTLFGKVQYEGHEAPKHIWQSHGSSDDFEPKFGLVPLIFGTLKGTFYAMLFSVPLALLAGLYTSQFLEKRLRAPVKSTMELMAAIPSVVLGFIAGLIIAPFVQDNLFVVMLLPVAVPAVALLGMALTTELSRGALKGMVARNQLWMLLMWLAVGLAATLYAGPWIEARYFGGEFQAWLLERWGIRYEQRNALVVGWAMGFAVIPIIFTICEDAFSSVPKHLIAASLACGATKWQTASKVVLPAAGSAVFSAVMIGLGRSIGETMIVLMATGNTPIMDGSIFNGFRALSANIAVEIPEAPVGGTHYRVLFVTALLLFAMTFVLNTAAELVRLRLRRNLEGI